ncbi:MAG: MYXO-CTERM domain-containing protein [Pseudoalteromonas tetraodonis]|jgi:MYXO-CTERM domain-containing protein
MKKILTSLAALFATASFAGASHNLITPIGVTTTSVGDLWPASNLIQGPGVGIDAADPHDKTSAGAAGNWVTAAPGGFPSDYIAVAGAPILTFDLGGDTLIDSIHTWGYATTNANGVKDFSLRFATSADGLGGFGSSIIFNPTYSMTIDDISMQTNTFGQNINAQYVEFTALSSHITNGGSGPPAGGDRVGLGEISFGGAIPEPSVPLLGLVGLAGFALRRRR